MTIEETADQLMQKFKDFTHGFRVCMLINRAVGNTNKGSKRWVTKLFSESPERLRGNIVKLLFQQETLNDPDIRLYMCVNPRRLDKAIKIFQHKQLDLSAPEELSNFYCRINDSFCSAIMAPEARGESLFLLDWDDVELTTDPFWFNERIRYRTPNGWHIVCGPYNPASMICPEHNKFEIKKDALLLLHTLAS